MKRAKITTFLWFSLGIFFALLVLLVVRSGLAGNVLVVDPEGIPEAADAVLNCIHTGNWQELEELVSGKPSLTPFTGEADSAEAILYDAFRESLQWTCEEAYRIQGSLVTQAMTVTCLDIRGVTDAMAVILAESNAFEATGQEQARLLQAAAKQVLETQTPITQSSITLTFRREQERWMLVPNNAFKTLLSGFTAH